MDVRLRVTRPIGYEPDCVFCEIAAGELPARFLYADGTVVSFLDIAPATRGHALVVPRAHSRDLWEIHDDELVAVSPVRDRPQPSGSVEEADFSLRMRVLPGAQVEIELHPRLVVAHRRKARGFEEVRSDLFDDASFGGEICDEVVQQGGVAEQDFHEGGSSPWSFRPFSPVARPTRQGSPV
jgi:HIT domain